MSEFIRKICLDSRCRVSGTTTDYEIELPRTGTVIQNALGWITDLHLPVTFYNIDQHTNRLYVFTGASQSGHVVTRAYAVEQKQGNYTGESLAAALRRNLDAAATGAFSRTRNSFQHGLVCQLFTARGVYKFHLWH